MTPILLRGARVIDPSRGTDGVADVYVVDGRIEAIGRNIAPGDGAEEIDVAGKVIAPGLIDLHVHLREQGAVHAFTRDPIQGFNGQASQLLLNASVQVLKSF